MAFRSSSRMAVRVACASFEPSPLSLQLRRNLGMMERDFRAVLAIRHERHAAIDWHLEPLQVSIVYNIMTHAGAGSRWPTAAVPLHPDLT